MKIKYNEIRREYTLDYSFQNETITVDYSDDNQTITDTFVFSALEEGDEFRGVNTDIPVNIFHSAKRINDELEIELIKPYGLEIAKEVMAKGDAGFPFSREWQVI